MYVDPNPRAVVGNNTLTVDEAIARFNRSGYMLARYETLAKAVRDDRIDRGCLKVLAVLVATMNFETCTSWAGRETIAQQTGMTVKSVSNYVHQLKCLGYIVSERRPTPHANGRVLMHYALSILSPDEIEAAVDWAVQCIRGEVSSVIPFPPAQEPATGEFPSGQELGATSSRPGGNSLPVRAGTQGETSRSSRNQLPAGAGIRAESSRQDGRSNITTISTNKHRAGREPDAEPNERVELIAKAKRGTRLDEGFRLPQAWGNWALEHFDVSRQQVLNEAEQFKNYWLAKPGQGALKLDWFRTWQNWCSSDRKAWRRRAEVVDGDGQKSSVLDAKTERELREIRAISSGGR